MLARNDDLAALVGPDAALPPAVMALDARGRDAPPMSFPAAAVDQVPIARRLADIGPVHRLIDCAHVAARGIRVADKHAQPSHLALEHF